METSKSFKDLLVWKKAHQFVIAVYKLTSIFPKNETYGLSSQFRRAAVSIAANIAEGFCKRGAADKVRYYNISQGPISECQYYLILTRDLDYCDTTEAEELQTEISKLLDSYSRSLINSKL